MISGAKELYDSTNKANLSGAIDVVVVKQVSTVLWCAAAAFTQIDSSSTSSSLPFHWRKSAGYWFDLPFFFLSFWCLRLDWIGCTQLCSFAALTHVDLLHNEHYIIIFVTIKFELCIHIISLAPNTIKSRICIQPAPNTLHSKVLLATASHFLLASSCVYLLRWCVVFS